uniref:Uncharacterized protein n=1 Tax=uncultured nuHF2 cluster bacterium HF0500_31B05 TaxID=723589 RepID=E7C5W6_9BACT|nr:hypothetical protein [uncultured nuHF2 cluster bacterium HF0500_31B05]
MQTLHGLAPQAAEYQVVPFGDEIVDGTTGSHTIDQRPAMAERHPAIHAAGPLILQLLLWQVQVELVPITHPLLRGTIRRQLPLEL